MGEAVSQKVISEKVDSESNQGKHLDGVGVIDVNASAPDILQQTYQSNKVEDDEEEEMMGDGYEDAEDGEDGEAPDQNEATGHFKEAQFLEEVANSRKMADEFEKNFQRHREAQRASQNEFKSEGTDLPELIDKAKLNNRVVPPDEGEDDEDPEDETVNHNQTENTFSQRNNANQSGFRKSEFENSTQGVISHQPKELDDISAKILINESQLETSQRTSIPNESVHLQH